MTAPILVTRPPSTSNRNGLSPPPTVRSSWLRASGNAICANANKHLSE